METDSEQSYKFLAICFYLRWPLAEPGSRVRNSIIAKRFSMDINILSYFFAILYNGFTQEQCLT